MNLINALMGNKSLLNGAVGMLKKAFLSDGVTAVFITPSDDMEGDTPGLKIQQFTGAVAVLTGNDLDEYIVYRNLINASGPGTFLTAREFAEYEQFRREAAHEAAEQRQLASEPGMSQAEYDAQFNRILEEKEVRHV